MESNEKKETEYIYWTFECKTPGCNTAVAFAHGGVYEQGKSPLLFSPTYGPVPLKCNVCGQEYEYTLSEIQPEISPIEPSPDFPQVSSK
jgi:hypothetical protein